jgi:aryl-alcohol dehydrogenase-like predicted oxidoreductase
MSILDAAVEDGVSLFDTADVYGDGRSEQTIGRFLRANPSSGVLVATKMGRRVAQDPANYKLDQFRAWTDRSRRNLEVDRLDLIQLHCPPSSVYASDEVFDALDTLVDEQRVAAYGVSVETVDEALTAIAKPNVASVQIILNPFRQKPVERVLPAARDAGVAILARVPLASGLLSGKYTHDTRFAADDHRSYNRHGEAFDVGETFSGVDFDRGIEAARDFAALAPSGMTAAQLALRWILDQPGTTTVIPGARTVDQVHANTAAASLPPLDEDLRARISGLYDRQVRPLVHSRW